SAPSAVSRYAVSGNLHNAIIFKLTRPVSRVYIMTICNSYGETMNTAGSKSPAPDANALESAIGGKLAVWVGAVALALGGVFRVKFSIEQGWLIPELRVIGGLALGAALGGVAWRLRDRSNCVA